MGIVVFAVGQQLAVGRILVPQSGDPVLVTDRLIFTEPGSKPHRLICIATDGGKKIWEIANRAEELKAWCVVGKDVIVSAGPDLYRCDTQLGRLELLHRTKGIYTPFVEDQSDGTLLVASGTARMGYLARIDARTGRVVWKRERIEWWLRGAKAGPLFFSLSLPDCEWGPLEESVWKAVTRRPKAEDQAFSSTSTISAGWERTSILRTDLKSGASSVLYEEEVPEAFERDARL